MQKYPLPAGTVMLCSLAQPSNESSPMDFTDVGRLIDVMPLQLKKALAPIVLTPSGTVSEVMLPQP